METKAVISLKGGCYFLVEKGVCVQPGDLVLILSRQQFKVGFCHPHRQRTPLT